MLCGSWCEGWLYIGGGKFQVTHRRSHQNTSALAVSLSLSLFTSIRTLVRPRKKKVTKLKATSKCWPKELAFLFGLTVESLRSNYM